MSPLLLGVFACTPDEAPATSALTDPSAPWTVPATTAPTDVPLPDVAQGVQDALDRAVRFDPEPVLAAYRDLAAGADAACPAFYTDGEVRYWLDQCTAGSGTTFDGYGVDLLQAYPGASVETVGGVATVSRPGTSLALDGAVQRAVSDDGAVVTESLYVAGTFDTDHPAVAGTWVEEGVEPDLYLTRYRAGNTVLASILDGSLIGLSGPLPVVAFDQVILVDPAAGIGDCDLEPAGTVSALGPDGRWVDLVFDPVLQDDVVVTPPGTCDGCARAWAGPEALGEVCFDFGAWR
ncbi:MAG: hypothetical protein R3F59_10745 [Myxococcota bacterium]